MWPRPHESDESLTTCQQILCLHGRAPRFTASSSWNPRSKLITDPRSFSSNPLLRSLTANLHSFTLNLPPRIQTHWVPHFKVLSLLNPESKFAITNPRSFSNQPFLRSVTNNLHSFTLKPHLRA